MYTKVERKFFVNTNPQVKTLKRKNMKTDSKISVLTKSYDARKPEIFKTFDDYRAHRLTNRGQENHSKYKYGKS